MKNVFMTGVAALALAACGGGSSPEEVSEALVQLSLNDSGSGRVEFEDKSVSGSDATFKNVKILTSEFDAEMDDEMEGDVGVDIDADGSDLMIDEMKFAGLALNDAGQANFSKMTLSKIRAVPSEASTEQTANISVEMIELDDPTPELAAWLGGVFGTAEPSDIPTPDNVQFESFKLTNFLAEDLEGDGGQGRVSVASIIADKVGSDKIGELALNDFDMEFNDTDSGNSGTFKLGKIGLKGANAKYLQAMLADSEDEAAENIMQTMYANPLDPGFDNFVLSDLALDMAGLKVTLPKMSYDIDRNGNGVPTKFTVPKFNLKMTADENGGEIGAQLAPMLLMVGFEDIEITGEGVSTYDPKTDIATTERSVLDVKDALVFNTTSKIGGMREFGDAMQAMDSDAFAAGEQDPNAMMMDMYSDLDFHEFTFSIEDKGVVNKTLMFFATQQGSDPEQLRQLAVGMVSGLPAMASGMGVDPALATELSAAVSSFIADGGTLTIAFEPEEPFQITTFMEDPSLATKKRLGFSAKTE